MKVLILGSSGMLGHKLAQVIGDSSAFEVVAAGRRTPKPEFQSSNVTYLQGLDLSTGSRNLGEIVRHIAPDVIVNAIGAIKQRDLYAAIDETFYVNSTLPHLLCQLNPNREGRVIHFSTDCVFKGDRGNYTEADRPDVEDLYGRSKACGEIDYGRHLTIRTSIIGFELAGHLGLLGWFFRQPRGSSLQGFTHAIFSGLPTVTLSRTVRDLLVSGRELSGLYHAASEPIRKYDLLSRINDVFDLGHTITPSDSLRIDRSLDDTRFRAATGTQRPGWTELLAELHDDYMSRPYAELLRSQITA